MDSVYETIIPTGAETPAQSGLDLTARQQGVCQKLIKLDAECSDPPASTSLRDMYLGAVSVLKDASNTDRFAQAAHSLRELIEKFCERRGGPLRTGASLTDRVTALQLSWNKCDLPSNLAAVDNVELWWCKVQTYLGDSKKFFEWFDPKPPGRREQLGVALGQVAPAGERLPDPIEKRETDRWFRVRKELIAVAHHGPALAEPEFGAILEKIEGLILEPVDLRTFERFDQIDRILAQAETRR